MRTLGPFSELERFAEDDDVVVVEMDVVFDAEVAEGEVVVVVVGVMLLILSTMWMCVHVYGCIMNTCLLVFIEP